MRLLDRQTGAVHLPEAKEVLSPMTKPIIKTRPTTMNLQSQWSCDSNAQESRKGWEREREGLMGKSLQGGPGMGKARLRPLGRRRDKRGSFPQTWTSKWLLSLTASVSHREKSGIISSPGSPGRRRLASACVTGSFQVLLTPTTLLLNAICFAVT